MGVLAIGPVEPPFLSSPKHWMAVVVGGVLFVLGLFIVMSLVRYWAQRIQRTSKPTGGIDLETLRRQRDAGNISQEEYERIRGTMTGARPAGGTGAEGIQTKAAEPEEASPERPINPSGGPVATGRHGDSPVESDSTWRDGQPGRSESNGQG